MRTVNENLVVEYADKMRPLLPLARTAYGTQGPDSPARLASDEVNRYLIEYVDRKGGNITHLANELGTELISLAGLRRRLRSARNGRLLGASAPASRKRGSKDPARVESAADLISAAREESSHSYGAAVREVYNSGVSLSAVAKKLDCSYFTLWTAGSHNA